jgi:hypothetical protein
MVTDVVRCPHCHLKVTLGETGKEPSIQYDVQEWQERCRYPELGGAGWCLAREENSGSPTRKLGPTSKR